MNHRAFVIKFAVAVMFGVLLVNTQSFGGDKTGRGHGKNRPQEVVLPAETEKTSTLSIVLGCPTDKSVIISILSAEQMDGYVEYGTACGQYKYKTGVAGIPAGKPTEILLDDLNPDTLYFYRLNCRKSEQTVPSICPEYRFHTQRAPGSTFCFVVQGDSHPERKQMNDPELYARVLLTAAADNPDFYVMTGDDFSVDTLKTVNAETVVQRYILQRSFLGLVGNSSPIFLVNGNHEQAAACNLNGTADNVAVWAQNARNLYYPQPGPNGFYTGDIKPVEFIGQLKDYYAWTWGDALFVVIDPYWHSTVPVDNVFGGGQKRNDMWAVTLGDAQYQWFKQTLEKSKAKFKFVFTHHVLGTGRGGIENADLYEWGGRNSKGQWEFSQKRPGWEMPIHQLMAKNGVTIFFQGHDHIFARQELDGVVYQTLPVPADPRYKIYNDDAYRSGVKMGGAGYVRITVFPDQVEVNYIQCRLPEDETDQQKNGRTAYCYTVKSR